MANNNENNFFNPNINNSNFNQQHINSRNNYIYSRSITPEFYHYVNYMYYSNDLLRNIINNIESNNNNLFYFAYNSLNNQYNNNQYNNTSPIRYNEFNSPERQDNNNIQSNLNANNDNQYNYNNNQDNNETNNLLNEEFQNIIRQIFQQARERDNISMYNYMIENCVEQLYFNEIENPINSECPILQSHFQQDDVVVQINRCSHIFDAEAIKNWLRNNHSCPVCRCNLIENSGFSRNRTYSFFF